MIKSVLLGIGGTPFTQVAIRRAVELSKASRAHLTAVTVLDERRLAKLGPVPVGGGAAATSLREHRLDVMRERVEEAIETLKAACEEDQVKLSIQREQGDPFQLMVSHARHHDLMVFGLRSMFEYDLLGDLDVKPAEMLARMVTGGVRPIIAAADRFRPIRRVLIAYGGSVRAAETMKQFVQFGLWPDATLRILACEDGADDAQRLLNDASIYCRLHGREPELVCRPGAPKRTILAEAEDCDADMIVLGTSRSGLFSGRIFGTAALEVIRRADRSLFLGR